MKKAIYILLVSALAFVGCTDEKEVAVNGPAAYFDVSSSYVVFSHLGGTKTVLVTSSGDWGCSTEASWFSLSKGDGELVITASSNDSVELRDDSVTLVSDGGEVKTISVAQRVSDDNVIDLSAEENANCYITGTETTCRFDATVKGNGVNAGVGGIASYIELCGATLDAAEIVYADLLWEATIDADKTRSYNIIDGSPVYSDGYVYFTTGTAEGNAVIAVKNANGEILWSWHIWVTNAQIAETMGNGYYWMDRNLGANSTEEADINNRGLLYQWGRKDPFLPSYAAYDAAEINVYNMTVGDGSGNWVYTGYLAKPSNSVPGNIPDAVENPMKIILPHVDEYIYHWYMTRRTDEMTASYLWGDSTDTATYVKSIFDPCPAGYNVPVDNAWMSSKDASVNVWDANAPYGRYWTGGGNAYYPCAGGIHGFTGEFKDSTLYGNYWCSGLYNPSSSYYCNCVNFNPKSVLQYAFAYPVYAFSVRCMRVE
ncbi:MAG: BACON domain-containing protein [Bacteroidales bacterium]|nr:BACON domain-containing protein [Bacteroidales bacterium]